LNRSTSLVLVNSPFGVMLPATIRTQCSINKRRQIWGSFQCVRLTWPNLNTVILFHAFCTRARHSNTLWGNNSSGRPSAGFIAKKTHFINHKMWYWCVNMKSYGEKSVPFVYTDRCNINLLSVCLN